MDCGDWIVVAFLVAFTTVGAVYLFKHASDLNYAAFLGLATIANGTFHWLRVKYQKVADA